MAAAYSTTIGAVREFQPSSARAVAAWDDSQEATLCYLDGPFPKAPPPHDGALVVDDSAVPLVLGYQERITNRDPDSVP